VIEAATGSLEQRLTADLARRQPAQLLGEKELENRPPHLVELGRVRRLEAAGLLAEAKAVSVARLAILVVGHLRHHLAARGDRMTARALQVRVLSLAEAAQILAQVDVVRKDQPDAGIDQLRRSDLDALASRRAVRIGSGRACGAAMA